jgi:hypothetical protein
MALSATGFAIPTPQLTTTGGPMAHAIRLTVALESPLDAVVAAFRDDPDTWLPTPLRRNGIGNWQVYLWAGEIGVLVDCGVSDAVWNGARWHRGLRWLPLRGDRDTLLSRAVPSLHGALSVVDRGDVDRGDVDRGDDGAELVLSGHYRPPGGAAGSLIDRVALHRLARRTGKVFLSAVADRLSELAVTRAVPESETPPPAGGGGVSGIRVLEEPPVL